MISDFSSSAQSFGPHTRPVHSGSDLLSIVSWYRAAQASGTEYVMCLYLQYRVTGSAVGCSAKCQIR